MTETPPFRPENPDYDAVVRKSFAQQGLMRALGISLADLAPGACVLQAAHADHLTQQQGFFHGALVGAMLDCAAGYAAFSLMPAGTDILTTEYKINFMSAARGERVIARGRVIKAGRRLTVASAEAYCRHGEGETLCAVMLSSLIAVPVVKKK